MIILLDVQALCPIQDVIVLLGQLLVMVVADLGAGVIVREPVVMETVMFN